MIEEDNNNNAFLPEEAELRQMTPDEREAYIGDILHFNKWIADPERKKEESFKHIIKDLETSNLNTYELFNCYYDLELIDLMLAYPDVFGGKSIPTFLRDLYGYMALSKSKGGAFMKALTTKYNINKQELVESQQKGWFAKKKGDDQ